MELELDVGHRAGFKSQAADALSRLEKVGTDNPKLDDDLPKLMVSSIELQGGIITNDQDGNCN